MKRVPIHRQRKTTSNDDAPLTAMDFTFYAYPYDRLPLIVSHVHPRYVIHNAGQKISRNCRTYLEEYPSLALDILGVKDTYEAWTSAPKYNDPFFSTALAPQDVDIESDSNATRKRRAKAKPQKPNGPGQTGGRHSKRTKEQHRGRPLQLEYKGVKSPPHNESVERVGSPSENWLDEQTLKEFDENKTLNVEKSWDTRMSLISKWVDDVMSHCQAFQVLQLPEDGAQVHK